MEIDDLILRLGIPNSGGHLNQIYVDLEYEIAMMEGCVVSAVDSRKISLDEFMFMDNMPQAYGILIDIRDDISEEIQHRVRKPETNFC